MAMELTTRCPQCGTVFSANLQQLQLRKGFIRCVQCAHIFDGYEAVVPPDEAGPRVEPSVPSSAAAAVPTVETPRHSIPLRVPERPAPPTPMPASTSTTGQAPNRSAPSVAAGRFTISAAEQAHASESRQDPVFKIGSASIDAESGEPRVRPLTAGVRAPAVPSPVLPERPPVGDGIYIEPRRRSVGTSESADRAPFHTMGDTLGSSWTNVLWGVLTLVALVVLAGQVLYVYRAQIANQAPALRPMLESGCVSLGCTVPYAREIDQISVTSSALRAAPVAGPDKSEGGNQMMLQFTLRNAYDKPQEWPTMVLDLKDFSGTLVVRKNLAPSEYLAPDTSSRPFPASSELSVTLPIVLDGLKVNGYQLDKFFQ
jgi:predicted Zn finger-like uncharacterized protein